MRALIVGEANARGALAAARALSRAGWAVGVGLSGGRGLASASRHVSRRHSIPAPATGLRDFVEATRGAIAQEGYEVVFGSSDAEVLALSAERERLDARVPYGPHSGVLRALDKLELDRAARAAAISTPRIWTAHDGGPAASRVVVKARLHSLSGIPGGPPRLEARVVSRSGAARRAAEIRRRGGEPIFQELVTGRLTALTAVADGSGRLLGTVQQMADGTWPPGAGVTARGRTIPVNAELASKVAALLRELDWFGLAELQFLVPEDGDPRLIDLNGRFYGSLALAVGAGANLPAIWAALATGRLPPPGRAAAGVRYQWLEGDLRRALRERRGGLARDAGSCLCYAPGARHSVLRADDPWPAIRYLARIPARAARRLAPP